MMDKFDVILIRYGEIAVKSKEVRIRMERRLVNNIRSQLTLKGLRDFKVRKEWGRIFLEVGRDLEDYVSVLTNVFGITSVSPCIKLKPEVGEIKREVVKLAREVLKPGDTFEVRVRRAFKGFPLTSKEMEELLGSEVLKGVRGVKVDLEEPDRSLSVEIRREAAYLYYQEFEGPGGLPYGVEGRVVSLISGGTDSTLATWMMMKRGCEVIPVHYDLTPFYGDDAKERLKDVLNWLRKWVPRRRWYVYIIPLGEVHAKLNVDVRYRCLLCKLLMYKVAENLAFKEGAKALVTGESVGQVASQTLDNLYFLTTKVSLPVFRPLIGFDKEEIVRVARKLGLVDITLKKVTACTLYPKARGGRAITHATDEALNIILNGIKSSSFKDLNAVVDYLLSKAKKVYVA